MTAPSSIQVFIQFQQKNLTKSSGFRYPQRNMNDRNETTDSPTKPGGNRCLGLRVESMVTRVMSCRTHSCLQEGQAGIVRGIET